MRLARRVIAAATPTQKLVLRSILAVLPPIVALLLQLALRPFFHPHVWFLFYPAIFLSSWIGGLRAGVVAAALSGVLALWFFVPPEHSFFRASLGQYLVAGVLFASGVLFGFFHDRLRRANQRSASALAASEQANADLRKVMNERRIFAALIEHSPDFIGIADPEGKPVYVNPAGRRMAGLAPDQSLEGTTITDFYPPELSSYVSGTALRALIEQGQWQGETTLRHWPTGGGIPVSERYFLIPDPETGAILGTGTITRDISELKRAREDAERARRQVQQASEEIASLVEQAPDGIFVADLDGRYTSVNTAGCRMLGYTREEVLGKTIMDLIPPDRVGQLQREKAQLLEGKIQVSEWTLRRKDGTYLPVEVSAKILPDGRWQGFARDISARVQLEEALRASYADLSRAQSVAKVGSWRLDLRNNELRWSDETRRIFGVPRGATLTYEEFLARVHPDDRAHVDREWTAALRGKPYEIEHRIISAGATRWVREKADLEFDEQGNPVGGIGITQDITDRKQVEQELREAQERFELALRGADLAAWDWNIETGEVVFNARWAELRGFRPEEIRGHVDTWSSRIHPEDWPRVREVLEGYLQGRRADYEVEQRTRTKSGEWIWIFARGKVFARNERGEPIRMAGTELDITDRKRAEEDLRLAEARASGIVSISADAIIAIDEAQRITLFNEGAERIFGYAKAEALGAPLDLLIPERYRAVHRRHVDEFAQGREIARRMGEHGEETLGRRKNGEEFPVDAAISKLEVSGSKLLTIALRDVTEQKRLEREQRLLAESGAVFASTLDYEATLSNIAEVAVRSFADFCIVEMLEEGELRRLKVVSRDPEQAWICDLLVEIALDRSRPHLTRAVFTSQRSVLMAHVSPEMVRSLAQSEKHLRALQSLDPKSVIAVPLQAHGKLLGALALVSATESRVYGPSDLRLGEELALRAALAIDNARLYHLATRASALRDELLGIVAHDLRNPVGAILMQAALLRRPGADPEGRFRRSADAIDRAATRMNRLIRDLLDVARMEAGRLPVERGPLHTAALVADSIEAQKTLASSSSIDLRRELAKELPDIWADRDRLLQVFENLIGNAIKFTKPGGAITVGAVPRNGDVLFWVRDTGVGISKDDVPRIFDRFWQAGHAQRAGAGLGLPIVKGIVEAHDGHVWVVSTLGRGSSFFFTIPIANRPEQWRSEPAVPGP